MTIYKSFRQRLDTRKAIPAGLFLLAVIIVEIAATIYLPHTRKPIYDTLEKFSHAGFISALLIMFYIHVILLTAQGVKTWLAQRFSFVLREALMKTIKKTWITRGAKTKVSVPCARLNDDVRVATETAISVFTELVISFSIVVGLIFSLYGSPLLLGSALIYSAISVGLAVLFRKPIVSRRVSLLDAEGSHRVSLTLVSTGQGDFSSKAKWEVLRKSFYSHISMLRNYRLFGAVQNGLMIAVPFLLLVPDYFNHLITLGDVMQGTLSFDLLVLNAAIWVQLYPQVTDAQAALLRVNEFYEDVHSA